MAADDRSLQRPASAPDAPAGAGATGGRIGVLLSNLGTPDGTTYWPMRRYLAEFLSDRRVIEAPRLVWFFILNGLILTTRPARRGRDYASIWNKELDESPLKTITRGQTEKLQASIDQGLLGSNPSQVIVEWGMRYGNPSLESAVTRLTDRGCERILLVPLYPQYSAATTATACDKVFQILSKMRRQPTLRVAAPYFDEPAYIDEIARSIERRLAAEGREPEVILASFHGMPQATSAKGDPYYDQCRQTVEALRQRLGTGPEKLRLTFQSRFGGAPWLQPYTDVMVKALAAEGVKRIAVVTPGFSADCLETIEEIGVENAAYFLEGGGEDFTRIDCLNDSEGGMRVIETVVRRELQGWI
ncbi:MAG: ferrochelatase [Caulobacteraceae bacterium]|nr:ferrochelatase [Caulobacteraceae bacterium]